MTIPLVMRDMLGLKSGDKVFFEESKGKVYIANASQITLSNIQSQMRGEGQKKKAFKRKMMLLHTSKN